MRINMRSFINASAISTAKCLSHLHGHSVSHGWPVLWEDGEAHVYCPPKSGVVSVDYITTARHIADHRSVDRSVAIAALHDTWDEYLHLGDVPTDDERSGRICLPDDSILRCSSLVDVHLVHEEWHPGSVSTGARGAPHRDRKLPMRERVASLLVHDLDCASVRNWPSSRSRVHRQRRRPG